MANEQNLIPFDERTESEQREIATAGGIASGAARRRKRALKGLGGRLGNGNLPDFCKKSDKFPGRVGM